MVDAAIDDADLLDARRGVAGALGALEEAGERLEAGDTPAFRARALALFESWRAESDEERGTAILLELGELLEQGVTYDAAFRDVVSRCETYRHAVNDALKLKLQAAQVLNVHEAAAAWDGLVQIVVEVCGREPAAEIAARFDREYLKGRLAAAGFQLGARAIAAKANGGDGDG